MNAGGVPNTCKSNEELQRLYSYSRRGFPSGERVSNALVTCPKEHLRVAAVGNIAQWAKA